MSEPVTTNKYLIVPNTGNLPGTWGTAALNPNFQIIDAMFGGQTTIALSSATTLVLTVPSATGDWAGVVPQSTNAVIKFTGAQTGTAVIRFTLPGFYIVDNRCTGTTIVQLQSAVGTTGAGYVCAPPGQKVQIFHDGTAIDFVNQPAVGSSLDLVGATTVPVWITNSLPRPYLMKDGTVYNVSDYPALGAFLSSKFGGNGATTFGVPDERARVRAGFDPNGTGRLNYNINGSLMNSSGGNQYMPSHVHANTASDSGHGHTGTVPVRPIAIGGYSIPTTGADSGNSTLAIDTGYAAITVTNASAGSGNSENTQPTIISTLPLIKT